MSGSIAAAEALARLAGCSPHGSARRQKALLSLHAWFEDWSTQARHVVTRRDHLIRLGLARRRASEATKAKKAAKKQARKTTKKADPSLNGAGPHEAAADQ